MAGHDDEAYSGVTDWCPKKYEDWTVLTCPGCGWTLVRDSRWVSAWCPRSAGPVTRELYKVVVKVKCRGARLERRDFSVHVEPTRVTLLATHRLGGDEAVNELLEQRP